MKRTGPLRPISVTGYFLPAYEDSDEPVFVILENAYFVPVFSTFEKLDEYMPTLGILEGPTKVKIIKDGREFLESIRGFVRVMLDPFRTADGNTRWTEVFLEEDV